MLDTQLILIEGMSGAGKSTTAERLAARLREAGFEAASYHEFDRDNPIRTKASDAMRDGYEKEGPLRFPGSDASGSNPYGSEQWAMLAEQLVAAPGRVVVLESRYWQNALFSRFLNGWDVERLESYRQRISDYAAPARPTLIHLAYSDAKAVMERVYPQRTPEWQRWMERLFSDSAWCSKRGLEGREAVIAAYRAWDEIAERLFHVHQPHRLRLLDPADDWPAAMLQLDRFLEI